MNTLQTDPLFHRAAPRKAGRPVGARARVIQDPRALGIHHFAFVRSSLLGMDLRESFERYLAWSETTTDLRYVQNRRDALLKSIIEAGRHFDATLPKLKVARRKIDAYTAAGGQPIWLEVDGGVKADNIQRIVAAGADTCVAGSAVFGAPDADGGYRGVMNTLRQATRPA